MANVYKFENLENLLQCAICLDRFRLPKVLPCQHTFCLTCLQRIYTTRNRTITCPTCRKVITLKQGPDELPNNLVLISLMDVQPVKAKCPCCDRIETLTVCEHCNSTKCTNCNEKHISDIRESTQTALKTLENTNQKDLKESIHEAFKNVKNEISNQFLSIRQQHDSILLNKQLDILKQLDCHEQGLLTQVDGDLQSVEQLKKELTEKNYHLESKSEPELINLLTKISDVQIRLSDELAEHYKYLNSLEVSLQYDQDHIDQINEMSNHIQLSVIHTDENKTSQQQQQEQPRLSLPTESVCLTLRTFLNREYKFRVSLDKTILELKERFAEQENLRANEITLTHVGNFFDQLDDNRTLKSYDFNSTTVLMICIRK